MESSSLSSPTDVKLVYRSKMIKYAMMAGLLLGAVIAIIFGSQYVVHVRSMDSNPHGVVRSSVEVPTSLLTVDLSAPTTLPSRVVGAPTAFPTDVLSAPSVLPTNIVGVPTVFPTGVLATPTALPTQLVAAPTAMPTFPPFHLYCPSFATSNTNSATSNYAVCSITACPGDTVLMTTFFPGSCSGDTYLRLYDPSTGSELAADDDFNGSACSQITYLFTASCRTYELREGCYGSGSCGGRVFYSGSSAAAPTTFPSGVLTAPTILPTRRVGAPTVFPTGALAAPTGFPTSVLAAPTLLPTSVFAAPTVMPTFAPSGFYCPSFSTSNTNSATSNYAICSITACPSDTVTMTTSAPGSCSGDTYLRLYDPSTGEQLTYNDDYNGLCSQLTYTFTASCRTYELREGCWSSGSCGGVVYYSFSSAAAPTTLPTLVIGAPTAVLGAPTRKPTLVFASPTVKPTVVFASPTVKPTVVLGAPTAFPTGTFGSPTQQNIPESERDALYDLYNSTNGHSWNFYGYGSQWDFNDPYSNPCTQYWEGLYCSSWYSDSYYTYHIVELSLSYKSLIGTIPDSIGDLSYLQYLFLDFNLLFGSIPRSIGQLSSLYYLLLSNNYLSGMIPDSFGQQYSLGEFDVSFNYLEGSIPLSVFNIMWSVNVRGNLLSGSLPDMISNLYINRLDVSGNNMVGIIPSSLCASYYLEEVYLYGNNFQCYPQCLKSNIRYAYVGNTPLCHPVPSTAPSAAPTAFPTSAAPTLRPTSSKPTVSRTRAPTTSTSRKPTVRPSSRPPTSKPTSNPSYRPTRDPTITFTSKPTSRAPVKPTHAPSRRQTTTAPTTGSPTVKPTQAPSRRQTTTAPATGSPTVKPTRAPTRRSSRAPSI